MTSQDKLKKNFLHTAAPAGTAILGFILIIWWFVSNPVEGFSENLPGMDNKPEGKMKGAVINIGSISASFDGVPSEIKGEWPNFRGPDGDNIVKENIKLAEKWEAGGPPVLWSIDLGEGHSGPVIHNGKVYVLDYDEERRADMLRCFSLDDGKEIWKRGYDIFIKRNHGISRTVPAIKNNSIVSIGPKCQIMCLDTETGDLKWGVDLERDFETEVPLWYTGQCTFIEDSLVIVGVGGKSLMAAFHLETGEVVWEIPNPQNWEMSHSSVIKITLDNQDAFLYCALGGIICVSEAGEILFESNSFNHNVVAPTPVYCGDNRVLLSAGYGAGSLMIEIKKENEKYIINELQKIRPNQGIASEQQTPIYHNGFLFSIQPKDAGSLRNQFVCYHPDDITNLIWSSGKTNRYGLGPYIFADDKFYILSDEGELTMIKASEKEFIELDKAKVLNGHDAWGPMAFVQGRLIARDSKTMICLDLRKNK